MNTPNAFSKSTLHFVVSLLLTGVAGTLIYAVMDSATHFVL